MDRNSPEYYCEETTKSYKHSEEFIEYVKSKPEHREGLLVPVVTPRFVPTCTTQLMHDLGQLAKKHDTLIQTHIAENNSEIELVKDLHSDCKHYTDVYDKCGLLTNRTVMAHAIYLDDDELDIFSQERSCYCPLSFIKSYTTLWVHEHQIHSFKRSSCRTFYRCFRWLFAINVVRHQEFLARVFAPQNCGFRTHSS